MKILLAGYLTALALRPLLPAATGETAPWYPVSTDGWTRIAPASDSLVVHVSSTQGDDINDGLSAGKPKKTIKAAAALLRPGYPDQLLLRRGDTFVHGPQKDPMLTAKLSGRAPSEPMVIGAYGQGPRPVVKAREFLWQFHRDVRHLALLGLDIYNAYSDPDAPEFDRGSCSYIIRFVGSGTNLLMEDCRVRFGQTSVQGELKNGARGFENVVLRRNIMHAAWRNGSSTLGLPVRISNFYCDQVDGLLLEENLVDLGGWHPRVPGAGGTMFSHNLYLQGTCSRVILERNILSRGASQGVRFTPGGIGRDNLIVGNSIGIWFNSTQPAGTTLLLENNVVLEGVLKTCDPKSRGFDTAVWGISYDADGGILRRNLVAHRRDDGLNQGIFFRKGRFPSEQTGNISYHWDNAHDTPHDPAWPDPGRTLAKYNRVVRGGAECSDGFLNDALARPQGEWPQDLSAAAANRWIRAGFGL